jgi:hypothetical protein
MLRKLAPFFLLLSLAAPAEAQTPQPADDVTRARELFLEGAKLAQDGSWDAARDRFERSLKIKRAALTLYNLGIAQQETGRLVDALESFRAFLAQPVEPATQAYVAPVREVVTKLEARVVRVELDVKPAGLRDVALRVDGREARAASGQWVLDPGPHEIVAAAPGHGEVRQKAVLPEGGHTTLAINFVLAPSPPAPIGTTLPAALGISGLVLFAGGEVVFGIGAAKGAGSSSGGSATAMMVAGNAIAGAGAIAAGVGLGILLKRVTNRARTAPAVAASPAGTPDLAIRF